MCIAISCGNDTASEYASAKACLDEGVRHYQSQHNDSALLCLKQAEQLAEEHGFDSLLCETWIALAKVNAVSANFYLAHQYADKVYTTAHRTNDKERLAMSCNLLASIYDMQDSTERAFEYIDELKMYANYGSERLRAYSLANIGIFYMRKRQNAIAKEYLNQSIEVMPLADAFCSLAVICGREGDMEEAARLWGIALQTPDLYYKITFLKALATQYYQMDQFREAAEINDQVVALTDTLTRRRQTAQIQELQLRYDQQRIQQKMERHTFIAIVVILVLLIAGVWYVFYTRFKHSRMSRLISNSQSLVETYTRQIGQLEQSGKAAEQQIVELRKRISVLQKKQSEILSLGRQRYHELESGGKTVKWSKDDFEHFIEYYKVVDLPFVQQLETEYDNLSAIHKVFLILLNQGKTNDEVQDTMGLSAGAFRTMKYRIKKKQLIPDA
ncbi:MAG: hypothetical protein ACI4AM_05570 [Muribaculaceae bacterium]